MVFFKLCFDVFLVLDIFKNSAAGKAFKSLIRAKNEYTLSVNDVTVLIYPDNVIR